MTNTAKHTGTPQPIKKAIKMTVHGRPAQKGSKRAYVIATQGGGSRAVVVDDNKMPLRSWQSLVSSQAAELMDGQKPITSPVMLIIDFYFARPRSHYRTGKNSDQLRETAPTEHSQTPDLDKLLRGFCDALAGIVIHDDRQIVSIQATRNWTEGSPQADAVIREI